MFRRSNPWPSLVDLFSALMLTSLAIAIISGGPGEESERVREVRELLARVDSQLRSAGMGTELQDCGITERCLHVDVHFLPDRDTIYNPGEIEALRRACTLLKGGLDRLPREWRERVALIIEGHTDGRPPQGELTERARFLYNWHLSAARAASVLYEFRRCGLDPTAYNVRSVGKADSDPLCREWTAECHRRNRRTTLRIRVEDR